MRLLSFSVVAPIGLLAWDATSFLVARASDVAAVAAASQFVVTNLEVVHAPAVDEAIKNCSNKGPRWVPAGGAWDVDADKSVVLLCQERQRISSLIDASHRIIPKRIAAVSSPTMCEAPWKVLYEPREGVVLCVHESAASRALTANDYIADLSVSRELFYNDALAGWTTIPVNVEAPRSDESARPVHTGAFLSVRRPVVPITNVTVVEGDNNQDRADSVVDPCEAWVGPAWEKTATFQVGGTKPRVLCITREPAKLALAQVEVRPADQGCGSSRARSSPLSSQQTLCSSWEPADSTSRFVVDLIGDSMREVNMTTMIDAKAIHGGWKVLSERPLLFLRAVDRLVPKSTPELLEHRPLVAKDDPIAGGLSFKILQLADLHYTGDPSYECREAPRALPKCNERVMSEFVDTLLDIERPDFVVFTGDNVHTEGERFHQAAVDAVTAGVERRGVPFAIILGNHDSANGFGVEDIVARFMAKSGSYMQRGPGSVAGVGNYALTVSAPVNGSWGDGGDEVFRMYFLDSHAERPETVFPHSSSRYEWIHADQVAHYAALAASKRHGHRHRGGPTAVPAILFFHIPLPEYAQVPTAAGARLESVSAAAVNSHLFSTLVDVGDVKATFAGHDHVNDYCGAREGIQLCYGGGAGLGRAYGRESVPRRARVIEWRTNAADERELRTWKRFFGDEHRRQQEELLFTERPVDDEPSRSAPGHSEGDPRRAATASSPLGAWRGLLVAAAVGVGILAAAVLGRRLRRRRHVRGTSTVSEAFIDIAAQHRKLTTRCCAYR